MQTQLQRYPEVAATASVTVHRASAARLRVLHVLSRFDMGGTEQGVLKIIEGLGHADFENHICAVRGADETFVSRVKVPVKVSSVGTPALGFQFPFFRLLRLFRRFRPHIVHTRNFGSLEAIPAARLAGVPVIIHSEHGYEVETLKGLPLRRRVACAAFYTMADQVFAVSRELQEYHSRQSWVSPERFQVIHNGVNTELFRPRKELKTSLRQEFGIPSNRFIIGTVGRIVPIKDHKTLLRAAEALVRQKKDVQVVIVGAGPELPNLQAQAAASPELSGRILFVGASDRVSELLNLLDVFVLPSISEGMSNTILEAMSSGLPLVVTRAGGNPELVVDGRVGNLFNAGDVESLVRLLSQLFESVALRREYGLAARQRALECFSLSAMLGRYRDLYLTLASRRGVWRER